MTNDQLHDLIASYALDALDPDERRAYEGHLAGCEQCRADLAELQGTVGALARAAWGPAPPDELRGRILGAAREEGPSNVVAIGSSRRRFYAVGAAVAAVAAGIAIAVYAVSGGTASPRAAVAVDNGVAQLTVTHLGAAPSGKAWEIWVIDGKKAPQPAGLFTGGGKQIVTLTRPAPNGSTVAITLERASGATTPTSRIRVRTIVSA